MDSLLFAHFLLNKVAGTRRENHGNLHYGTKMKIEQTVNSAIIFIRYV